MKNDYRSISRRSVLTPARSAKVFNLDLSAEQEGFLLRFDKIARQEIRSEGILSQVCPPLNDQIGPEKMASTL